MATHFNILAWRIPWTEEPGGLYSSWGCKESDMTEQADTQQCTITYIILLQNIILRSYLFLLGVGVGWGGLKERKVR